MKKILSFTLTLIVLLSSFSCLTMVTPAQAAEILKFRLSSDYCILTECDEGASGEIIIPEVYNNLPVKKIEGNAFSECKNITGVVIPSTVEIIDGGAFKGCSSLEKLEIPEGVKYIGQRAFRGCKALKEIQLPSTVSAIEYGAFENCISLKYMSVAEDSEYFCSIDNVLYNKDLTKLILYPACKEGTSYKLPETIEKIEYNAFGDNKYLVNVDATSKLKALPDAAFKNCASLESIVLSEGLFTIGSECFMNCTSLKSICIPDGVTSILFSAFENCSALVEVNLPSTLVQIQKSAFINCSALASVFVPASADTVGDRCFGYLKAPTAELNTYIITKVENFEVSGYANSAAEEYALENGFAFDEVYCDHSETELRNFRESTCNSNGYSGDVYCKICRNCISKGDLTPFKDHNLSTIIKEATTTETGLKYDRCTTCGGRFNEEVLPMIEAEPDIPVLEVKPDTPILTSIKNQDGSVKITWEKIPNAKEYYLYKKTYNSSEKQWSSWKKIKVLTKTSFEDTNVESGKIYRYTVKAINGAGFSGYESYGLKIRYLAKTKISSVKNVADGVELKWLKVKGAYGYRVYRSTYSNGEWSDWKRIVTVKGTYYKDENVKSGVLYKYYVKPYENSYTAAYSGSVKAKFLSVPSLKTAVSYKSGIKLTWGRVTGAKGYMVYRRTYINGKWTGWTKIADINNKSTVTYMDKSAKKGVTYKYTVRAKYNSYTSYYKTKGVIVKDKY